MKNERSFMALALAAGAVFALALGIRSAQPLFISSINSATGIGYATISLAFGVAQLMWGIGQPVAGAHDHRVVPAEPAPGDRPEEPDRLGGRPRVGPGLFVPGPAPFRRS